MAQAMEKVLEITELLELILSYVAGQECWRAGMQVGRPAGGHPLLLCSVSSALSLVLCLPASFSLSLARARPLASRAHQQTAPIRTGPWLNLPARRTHRLARAPPTPTG